MPRKYVPKTKKFRRRPRKVYRRKYNMLSFNKAPVPNRFATKLRYVDYAEINPDVAGVAGVHVVCANGLYDPNITGVGHQPRGFDQIMPLYDHYIVIGAKITVQFMTKLATNQEAMMIGVALKDTSTVYADPNSYLEGRNIRSSVLRSTTSTGEGQMSVITKTFSCKKFLGRSHPLSDPELKGGVAGNPNEKAFFHIFAAPFSSSDVNPLKIQYRVEYLAVFVEPKQPSQS